MNFKPLTIADKHIIQNFTLKSSFSSCYLTFANLYCWGGFYNTQFAIEDGRLFLRYLFDDKYVYFAPTVDDGNDEPLRLILREATNNEKPFSLQCVDAATCKRFDAIMPEKIEWSVNRDASEYLYLRSDLESLAGKKFQPKRNHINQFLRAFPDYEYLSLTPELMPECLALERQWRKNAEAHEPFDAIDTIDAEHNALTTAFEHFAELDLTGAAIRADGKIVAFTYGAPINDEVFDICVEKADTSVLGTYPVINQQFARRLSPRFTYINREEDLGVPGLRKAKL
ncbi:MAG: phosphatidylglycerol lysyltransferase domain-containing protein, partial [Paludibacter sp.]|nr:phosphatidylglycerol lysyltransferase domain-containing protein [Paludibacter sp.]